MTSAPRIGVQSAIAPAISAVLAELRRLGVHSKLRAQGSPPTIWWSDEVSWNFQLGETSDVLGDSR